MSSSFKKITSSSSLTSKLNSINKINKTILLSSIKEDLIKSGYFNPFIKRHTFFHESALETEHFISAMTLISTTLHASSTTDIQSVIPFYMDAFSTSLSLDHLTLTIIYPVLSFARTSDDIISISSEILELYNTVYDNNVISSNFTKTLLLEKYNIKNVEPKLDIILFPHKDLLSIKDLQAFLSSNIYTTNPTKINLASKTDNHIFKSKRLFQTLDKTIYNPQNIIKIEDPHTLDLFI